MSELSDVVDGADVIIICAPHQFVRGICKQLEASGKVGAGLVDVIDATGAGRHSWWTCIMDVEGRRVIHLKGVD